MGGNNSKQQADGNKTFLASKRSGVNPPSNKRRESNDVISKERKKFSENHRFKQQADGSKPGSKTSSDERDDANPSNESDEFILHSKERKEFSEDHHSTERCQKVFKKYYARLCDCVPAEEVMPHLVSHDIITVREMEDILVEKTRFRQARALLNGPIWSAISGGYPKTFITFLYILHSIRGCKILCEEICTNLDISTEVISSESREYIYLHIDQF